ncbi:MAG: NifU N-terminal domain-containing protein [Actinobacteria bacterium]|nr:NifU N-terminal domain-containing protein [Actinomycetota bacterium]
MGQPITVVEKPTANPGVVRFEINRSLTGMGHERYVIRQEIPGHRPPDELARRLFARGGVEAVHIYSNVITVNLAAGADSAGLLETIQELFIHYRPGVHPPSDEELTGAGAGAD